MTHRGRHVAMLAITATALALAAAVARADAPPEAGPPSGLASALALPVVGAPATGSEAPLLLARRAKAPKETPAAPHAPAVLSGERARTLLRSLTIPGWGQAALGHRKSATAFAVAELAVWSTYTAFRIQEKMRADSYKRTALVLAGIDLDGRDEEFRRIVGSYISSDEYNQLVVYRDAANLFYDDHGLLVDPAGYAAYVAEHSLKAADHWEWPSDENLLRYRGQRKDTQRAELRANAALAMAVINRLLSAVHAARMGTSDADHSWKLESLPDEQDPTAFRVGVRARF